MDWSVLLHRIQGDSGLKKILRSSQPNLSPPGLSIGKVSPGSYVREPGRTDKGNSWIANIAN